MNTITDTNIKLLLNLEDENIVITDIGVKGREKIVMIETKPVPHFCPCCSFKMHSRGIKERTIRHPILQDGYHLVFTLKQRRWRCTNSDCMYIIDLTKHQNKTSFLLNGHKHPTCLKRQVM